ncbi:lactate utilization protein [Sphingobacterium sp. SRCM116780]|uniref:LutC/YkgG family protein n=1 Tax=Sphingobacterium sp. SRCM116780 TaxID=2907623 RepID=UPI001F2E974F|nr:lactate utilization protein [Sphingobacterium sp. SRCM116780]UIR55895.1 lactate utilization protein [Sphingobacterium sp. SRCM116780]
MNVKNNSNKEQMLGRIRQALVQKKENPHPNFQKTTLYKEEDELVDVTFARELTAIGGKFLYCDGEINLIENLILLTEENNIKKIFAWEKGIQDLLSPYGFPIQTTETNFDDADAGITSCEVLIARNGSVMVSNANASGRRLGIYPPIHIVIAKTSQMVWDLKDALSYMQRRYGDQMPTMVSTVTGPSRTADIEKRLVLGAHGPKELYVLLLEDRF